MFTGIIECMGRIVELTPMGGGRRLRVEVGPWARELPLGASVAVSGVCLTVCAVDPPVADFDVVAETLQRSTLGDKRPGDRVNLERALQVGGRLDGHYVQGHVDGIARATAVRSDDRAWQAWFDAPRELHPYLVPKGSVALEGVSLTIAELSLPRFSVALVPTTLALTTLAGVQPGDAVNVETDLLIRAVVHQLRRGDGPTGISLADLKAAGFA